MRVAMRRIRSFQPDDRNRVLEKVSRATQNTIARTRADDWLPAALAVEVCNALVDALGSERAVEFWRDVVYDSWVGGLLEPLLANGGAYGSPPRNGEQWRHRWPSVWLRAPSFSAVTEISRP